MLKNTFINNYTYIKIMCQIVVRYLQFFESNMHLTKKKKQNLKYTEIKYKSSYYSTK